jgi:hypothetical protein
MALKKRVNFLCRAIYLAQKATKIITCLISKQRCDQNQKEKNETRGGKERPFP